MGQQSRLSLEKQMSKEETLVEVTVIDDPLCGAARYFLTVKAAAGCLDFYESNSESEDSHKLASSKTPLTADQIADLLDHNLWFRCDITLEGLEDSQLAHPEEWVYGGEYPLLSCASAEEGIPERFHKWVKAYCDKILAERNEDSA
jgi:hypothetical protein